MNGGIKGYGFTIGSLPSGPNNTITDVEGVKVGHHTLAEGSVQTGVTAIIPHEGNIFQEKLLAGSYVYNGYGKAAGLLQIEELGTLETPIVLTNTLNVGTASEALVSYMLRDNEEIGGKHGTVNPVVAECNDGYLNDIRSQAIEGAHVEKALEEASRYFAQGSVGAGRGMSCFGLKGGIGSASRVVAVDSYSYTLGALVLANYGRRQDFMLQGYPLGRYLEKRLGKEEDREEEDKGSIIMVLATDCPLTERQLTRLARRTPLALARTGSYGGHGSGDMAIAFSTATRIPQEEESPVLSIGSLHESRMDQCFQSVVEVMEEAILNALVHAEGVRGHLNHHRVSLADVLPHWLENRD